MRSGADRLLARVVQVFGAAQAHHGYLLSNGRANRIKLLVHDGFGVGCAARRFNAGGSYGPVGDQRAPIPSRSHASSSMPWCRACPGSAWSRCSGSLGFDRFCGAIRCLGAFIPLLAMFRLEDRTNRQVRWRNPDRHRHDRRCRQLIQPWWRLLYGQWTAGELCQAGPSTIARARE